MIKIMPGIILLLLLFIALSLLFVYPIFQGLIILPLDLLVSNYSPWHLAGQILLKNPFMQDSIMQIFPWRHLVYETLRSGIIPFWNPYQFMGMPFMANAKSMIFYPLNVFFYLGEVPSWHVLLFFQLFGSMVFMYLFARSCGISKMASILSSISFSGSSLMIGVMEFGSEGNVLLWMPLFLFCAKRIIDIKKNVYCLVLGLSVACAVFAGHLQYLGYEMMVLVFFVVFYGRSVGTSKRIYLLLFLSVLLGIGICSVQLFASIEMFKYSYRGISDSYTIFSEGLLKPVELLRLIAPDFFGHPMTKDLYIGYIEQSGYFGLIPLFFCIYAIIFGQKNIIIKIFTGVFVLSILFSMDHIAQILYFLRIPLITSGYGGRLFSCVLFSGALLSGFGLAQFILSDNLLKKKYSILFIITTILLLTISLLVANVLKIHYPTFNNVKYSFILLVCLSIVLALYIFVFKYKEKLIATVFIVCILSFSYFDLFRLAYRFLTFSNSKFLYPETGVTKFLKDKTKYTLDRVYGIAEPEIPTYFGIQTLETYDPLYQMRTGKYLNLLQGKESAKLPINKYLLDKTDRLKLILDITGVKYIAIEKGKDPALEYFQSYRYQADLTKVYEDDFFDVYENNTVLPRFGLFYTVRDNVSDRDVEKILSEQPQELKNTIFIESALRDVPTSGTGAASLIHSSINGQEFEVKTDAPALFYITDAYYPGWSAYVNGKESKIYRSNYMFRSVLVPEGESKIKFVYMPSYFPLSVCISVISVIGLFVLSFMGRKKTDDNKTYITE